MEVVEVNMKADRDKAVHAAMGQMDEAIHEITNQVVELRKELVEVLSDAAQVSDKPIAKVEGSGCQLATRIVEFQERMREAIDVVQDTRHRLEI